MDENTAVHWRIRDDGDRILARNDETYEIREVDRRVAELHRVNVRQLAQEVCSTFDWTDAFEQLGRTQHVCRIGRLPLEFDRATVFFVIRRRCEDMIRAIDAVARSASGPFLMLTPTGDTLANSLAWAERSGGHALALTELLSIADGKLRAEANWRATVQRAFGIEPEQSPAYQFRLIGKKYRMAAFDCEPFVIKETPGSFYLAAILGSPRQAIRATYLESMRSGINEIAKTGSVGAPIDEECRRQYGLRLQDIVTELKEHSADLGEERLSQLHHERDILMQTLNSATGLGGKLRENSDADRARKAVGVAIRRSIKEIRVNHEPMADYLAATIKLGFEITYTPPADLNWHL
ncbi:hypothetical protein [Crateriforma conspicua]|uniref:hypothetical protein n=1 Tax=Crateriforma conspicua TaxID=2527996 RepID=UPI0011B44389|nr:hypothetical protein [Crateriforma conspicua]